MNKETAKKWLKDWKQDIDNLSIEVRGENVVPLVSVKMVVKHLLEAQKVVERERAVRIVGSRKELGLNHGCSCKYELQQEILQSTKE